MNKMTIHVGVQGDGYTFQLAPRSRRLLDDTRADETPLPASVFLRYEVKHSFVHVLGQPELQWTVAETLTGLRREEIEQIAEVEYVDPRRNFAKISPAA